jgi:hypothetical protein
MPPSMSQAEREEFLAAVHVGVLSVTVEGPAVIEESNAPERLELARRYLGTEGGDAFIAANPGSADDVLIRMTPERWLSVDYGRS